MSRKKYSLFPDKTVIENVTFGPEVEEFNTLTRLTPRFHRRRREFRAEALLQLRRMGLHDSDATKYSDQLSGGMQQRVAIAQPSDRADCGDGKKQTQAHSESCPEATRSRAIEIGRSQ